MTARTPEDSTAHVVDAVQRLIRTLRVASRRVEVATGISAAQLFVLQRLADRPALSLAALANATMTDRSSVAHVVDRLERVGLVQRERSQADRRRVEIAATAAGRRLVARGPESPTALLMRALDALTATEVRRLGNDLRRLVTELHGDVGPVTPLFSDARDGHRVAQGTLPTASRSGRRTPRRTTPR